MNYKTVKRAAEEESLLSSAWQEHTSAITTTTTQADGDDPPPTEFLLTPSLSSSKQSKNGHPEEGGCATGPKHSASFVIDGNKRSPLLVSSQQSANEEVNKHDEGSYRDWVSFEENSGHSYSKKFESIRTPSPIVSPNRNVSQSNGDDSSTTPGSKAREHNWLMFDLPNDTKSSEMTNSNSSPLIQQPLGNQQLESSSLGGELIGLGDTSLPHEALSNPFDNSELNRINPFQQTSPKRVNGCLPQGNTPSTLVSKPPTPILPNAPTQITPPTKRTCPSSPSEASSTPENPPPLVDYPEKPTNKTWSVWLRYPDTKRKLRPREWRPVVLKLDGSILKVFEEDDTSTPFREVSLQCFYELTTPALQNYLGMKVHTVKIMYVKYKETSKRLAKKSGILYISKSTPILKIASTSHLVIREFVEVVMDAVRSLPIFRDRGISHNTEAVYINVHDICSASLDSSGNILMIGILVRVYLRAFISGDAQCEMLLNDIHVKTKEEARLREEDMPQRVHKWIRLENCDFHSTVSADNYEQNHNLVFQPLDACTFEVMQFRVRQLKPLPLLVSCDLVLDSHGKVELRAEVKLCSDTKLAKYQRKNIALYFAIPDAWAQLFMTHKLFRGERSIRATSAQKAIKMRNRINRPPCTIEVSTGSAMYEPEYKSVVWRINQLPLLNTTAPADSAHDFKCQIQTHQLSADLPDGYTPECTMEYEIPYTVASDTNVINFKVCDQKIGAQDVNYNAYFYYHVQMKTTWLNTGQQDDRWIHD